VLEDRHLVATVFQAGVGPEPSRATWNDILAFGRRYTVIILLVMFLTVIGAYITISLTTEQYETEAKLLVKMGRENLDPPAVSRNMPLTTGLRPEELVSEIEILKSPEVISQVVDQIGVEAFRPRHPNPTTLLGHVKEGVRSSVRWAKAQYQEVLIGLDLKKRLDERGKAINWLMDSLTVEPIKDSDVIAVKLRTPDPALGLRIEDKLVHLYLARRIEVRSTPGVQEFLSGLAKEREKKLTAAEAQNEAWKKRWGIVSSTDQKALLLRQIRELSSQSSETQGEIESLTKEIETSRTLMAAAPEYQRSAQMETPNPAMQSIEEKLIALKLQRTQALSKYRPESDLIRSLNQEIDRLNEMLAEQKATQVGSVTSQLNPNRVAVEQKLQSDTIRLEGLRAKRRQQDVESKQLAAELDALATADVQLSDIERTRQLAEQDYANVVKRKFDSDVSTQLDRERVSNVSIAGIPSSSLQPVYPRKITVMAISLVVGLLLGISLALFMNYMDDSARASAQVELATHLPYIGSLESGDAPA
jgi:uncharacterized protein involved in exopolysaccharide biosynthesis